MSAFIFLILIRGVQTKNVLPLGFDDKNLRPVQVK